MNNSDDKGQKRTSLLIRPIDGVGGSIIGVGGAVLTVGEGCSGAFAADFETGVEYGCWVGVITSGDVALVVLNNAGGEVTILKVDCGPDDTAPFSRLTNFCAALFPEKNSPAVRAGSEDGAGG
jgi:hypothetical protein